jgi:RNA polymerase sigma-32 factor
MGRDLTTRRFIHGSINPRDNVMASAPALSIIIAQSGLSRYFEEIRRLPLLEPQEEFMLAKHWRQRGDNDAGHRLITSHLRLVAKIAAGYRGYGLPAAEIIAEGNLGLMQAVKRFEPERGFRLATYAIWWIRASIQDYVLRSWSLVKMGTTANQKKLFFNLRKAKSRISALEGGDLRPDQVQILAKRLGVTEQDLIDMNRRLGGDASLNAPIREEGDSGEWQDWLVDDRDNQESILAQSEELENRRSALYDALGVLNDRERRIFEARRLVEGPVTLEDLATEFGISRERVRQIEVRAFEKVQTFVRRRFVAIQQAPASAFPPRPESAEDVHWIDAASSCAPFGVAGHCSSMRDYPMDPHAATSRTRHWRCTALCVGPLAVKMASSAYRSNGCADGFASSTCRQSRDPRGGLHESRIHRIGTHGKRDGGQPLEGRTSGHCL